MLYQIVPPIIVIISAIGIIIFLIKKAPEINHLEVRERVENEQHFSANFGDVSEFSEKSIKKLTLTTKIRQFFLLFLEKLVKRSRLIFLKLENALKNLGEKIRKKRKIREIQNGEEWQSESKTDQDATPVTREKEALDGIVDKLGKYNLGKINIRGRLGIKQRIKQETLEDKFFRPIISDNVVVPKRRRETKNRLEELLIERIASNPKDIEAYERLGEYYLEVKNLEHSKECFKQVLRLNPTNRNARYKIRKLEKILGN